MSDSNTGRVDWVDYAKGFCIVFVVMMHSTLGVEQAAGQEGFMHAVVAFARPFRMPDFFLISGLFLAQVIDRDWRTYVDRKVVHFAYFYLLWTALQFAFKAPLMAQEHGLAGAAWLYAQSFWEPFGTLWFIYLLPIFFTVTRLAKRFAVPPALVWLAAAALESAPIATGSTVIDELRPVSCSSTPAISPPDTCSPSPPRRRPSRRPRSRASAPGASSMAPWCCADWPSCRSSRSVSASSAPWRWSRSRP